MQTLFTFLSPLSTCGYLPDRRWQLRYEIVGEMSPEDYSARMIAGWRRFGHAIFKPECPSCQMCQSIRVDVKNFRPDRSQRRARKANEADVRIEISTPSVSREKLALYDKFHQFQTELKGWPERGNESADAYLESFVDNPFVTEEWCYFIGDRLIGVGYADRLPIGISAIYFFYDPAVRDRSLGTFNVLSVIARVAKLGLPHAYLGFYVPGCRSLEYKATFRPNETRQPDGTWQPFVRL